MTDDEVAAMMVARLRGEPMGYVSWEIDGQTVEKLVIGETTVKIPRGAKNALYSWKKGVRVEQQFAWPVKGISHYLQPYEPWVSEHKINSGAARNVHEVPRVHFEYE